MAKDHWIGSAIKHPGAMTKEAEHEGVSNPEFEQEHKHDSGKEGARARLALTLKHMKEGGEVDCPHCGKGIMLEPPTDGSEGHSEPAGKRHRYGAPHQQDEPASGGSEAANSVHPMCSGGVGGMRYGR